MRNRGSSDRSVDRLRQRANPWTDTGAALKKCDAKILCTRALTRIRNGALRYSTVLAGMGRGGFRRTRGNEHNRWGGAASIGEGNGNSGDNACNHHITELAAAVALPAPPTRSPDVTGGRRVPTSGFLGNPGARGKWKRREICAGRGEGRRRGAMVRQCRRRGHSATFLDAECG